MRVNIAGTRIVCQPAPIHTPANAKSLKDFHGIFVCFFCVIRIEGYELVEPRALEDGKKTRRATIRAISDPRHYLRYAGESLS